MLHIFCPHCGELRSEEEFHASGQAHIPRPLDPNTCTDEEWGDYMFFRDNPRGLHHELWDSRRRLPSVLQRHPRHRDLRDSRNLQDRRQATIHRQDRSPKAATTALGEKV